MDSGITSRNATASMYPAPSAKKYCKYRRGQSRRTTKYPPTKFPAAATSPKPAASAVRNAKSCAIETKKNIYTEGAENTKSTEKLSLGAVVLNAKAAAELPHSTINLDFFVSSVLSATSVLILFPNLDFFTSLLHLIQNA